MTLKHFIATAQSNHSEIDMGSESGEDQGIEGPGADYSRDLYDR